MFLSINNILHIYRLCHCYKNNAKQHVLPNIVNRYLYNKKKNRLLHKNNNNFSVLSAHMSCYSCGKFSHLYRQDSFFFVLLNIYYNIYDICIPNIYIGIYKCSYRLLL